MQTYIDSISRIGPYPRAKVRLGLIQLEWYFALYCGCHYDIDVGPVVDNMPDDPWTKWRK